MYKVHSAANLSKHISELDVTCRISTLIKRIMNDTVRNGFIKCDFPNSLGKVDTQSNHELSFRNDDEKSDLS